jgi:hypothetical protein
MVGVVGMKNWKNLLRGQAAMEYLMTYGWALLVIAIVISILVLINPFSPPAGCRFDQVGFTCNPPAFGNTATNTVLYLQIFNGNNNNVRIYSVYCTADTTSSPPVVSLSLTSPYNLVPRQGNFTISPTHYNVNCYRNGALMGPSQAGSDFSGRVWIFYRNEEDGADYPFRTVSATISGKVSG